MENYADLPNLLTDELIFTNVQANSREELFSFLAKEFGKRGIVKGSFYEALLEREKNYPTGLFMEHIAIAIPHADKEHVNMPAVAVAKLASPVSFHSMEDAEDTIQAQVVVCLAFTQEDANVKLLPQILQFFMDEKRAKQFLECEDATQLMNMMRGEG